MRKINGILIIFLITFVVMTTAAWMFLQSRTFGDYLSKAVTQVLRQFDARVRFSQVDVTFFPPGVALEDVRLKYSRKGTVIDAEAGKLGIYFGLNFFNGTKFRIGEVYLEEGFAKIDLAVEESDGRHPWDVIQGELEKLPIVIDALGINDAHVSLFNVEADINHFKAYPGKTAIKLEGEFKHIQHKSLPRSIDLVKVEGELHRDDLDASLLQVIQNRSKIGLSGKVSSWAEVKNLKIGGKFSADVYVPDLHESVDLDPVIFYDGSVRAKGQIAWSPSSKFPQMAAQLTATSISANAFDAEKINATVEWKGERFWVNSAEMKNGNEEGHLLKPILIWDHPTRKLLPEGILVRTKNVELSNALKFIEELKPLKGRITGELLFTTDIKKREYYFRPVDGFKLETLRLELPSDNKKSMTKMLGGPVLWLTDSKLSVIRGTFSMKAKAKAPRTQLDIEGSVSKSDGVNFKVGPGPMAMNDLGQVANLEIKGEGVNTLTATGPMDDVKITLDGEFKNFEILGYKLGNTRHRMVVGLKRGQVEIPIFEAKKGPYVYNASGLVNFKNFLMDLSIDIPTIGFNEFKEAITPISGGLDFLGKDFEGNLQGNVELYAKDDIKNLKVGAEVYVSAMKSYGENIKDAKFTFIYGNRKIDIKNLTMSKEEGKVSGVVSYELDPQKIEYKLSLRQLSSDEINIYQKLPFSLNFKAAGEFQGMKTPTRWNHRGFLGLTQSHVHDKAIPNSTFEWEIRDDSVAFDAKVAKDWVLLNGASVKSRSDTDVRATLKVAIPDIPLFLRGFLGENPQLSSATGFLKMDAKLGVKNWEWNKIDLEAWLKEVQLLSHEISLQESFPSPQVKIKGGVIEKWNLQLNSPDLKMTSSATGDLRRNLVMQNLLDFDAKYLELLSRHIQRSEGRVKSKVEIMLKANDLDFTVDSEAKGLVMSTDVLPFALRDMNYKVTYRDRELEIDNFSFTPDSGKVTASGTMYFDGLDPDVNIIYTIDRGAFPIKNRTNVTLSGNGLIFGNKRPYVLSGDIVINKGSVLNEISDFSSKNTNDADTKYLPKDREGPFAGLVNVDLGVSTEHPININNSMMDLFLAGDVQLQGDLLRPSADGKVQTAGNQSKVFFKNSEYQITKAEFLFNGRKPVTKPDFDISATAVISNYKVTAKAFGNPDNFTFDLASDPPLSKQNILSLIAFGYTDDLSNSITADERQNLTNVGVGSFIFDQFKVTDIVKKQFGLQINMGTVFVQSDESMLQGRGQDQTGTNTVARTRTATNIEIKKRLTEAMSLSVSSTVGGSIGQRQKMNLNYGLTKNVQLEGVYELRTNAEGQEDIIDNSVGGDVKFRMTFK